MIECKHSHKYPILSGNLLKGYLSRYRDFDFGNFDSSIFRHGDFALTHFQNDFRRCLKVNLIFCRDNGDLSFCRRMLRLLNFDNLIFFNLDDVICRADQILILTAREIPDEGTISDPVPRPIAQIYVYVIVRPRRGNFSCSTGLALPAKDGLILVVRHEILLSSSFNQSPWKTACTADGLARWGHSDKYPQAKTTQASGDHRSPDIDRPAESPDHQELR